MNDKKSMSERDIISKYILPAIKNAGWEDKQIREEVSFTDGRIFVKGQKTVRGERKRADIILYCKQNIPLIVIEAKDNKHTLGAGSTQALNYAQTLDIPLAVSSNGDGFVIHYRDNCGYVDKNGKHIAEETVPLENFPTFENAWNCYCKYKGIENNSQKKIVQQDYYYDSTGRTPRYYQTIAINRTVEAIAKGQNRILLVMATGTGKTYTAFQIIWRLWKSGCKKRILYLADRENLIDQTKRGDFKYFGDKMTIVRHKKIDKAYEVYLALYQGLTNYNEATDAYRQFSPNFFDLVVVDECHRGSAADDSAWRKILEYFSSATQIGMTATPKETSEISSSEYFGESVYSYSLKQGIDDGFLAPYKVLKVGIDVDLEGWRPDYATVDVKGNIIEDRLYNTKDFDRNLVLTHRTETVAKRIVEYLTKTSPYDKTIVFCIDIEHAERMRQALWKAAPTEWNEKSEKYIVRITGDEKEAKQELDNFQNPEKKFPVIATTSKLLTTGTDIKTCKLIVLDANIGSMTEFKQIIGRGTRICEEYEKNFFTIMDFRNATAKFADPAFDGEAVRIKDIAPKTDITNDDILGDETEGQIDPVTGKEIHFPESEVVNPKLSDTFGALDIVEQEPPKYGKQEKVYVAGVEVSVLNERTQYLDANGKLITESLKDYTRRGLVQRFRTLDNFLHEWNSADKKRVLIEELEKQGIILENLKNGTKTELDIFDLICHIAFDSPALTRKERAENVRKRNCFAKYGEQVRAVLNALLEKYSEEGIENIEEASVLTVPPVTQFGTPMEIVKMFGGKEKYLVAIKELEKEIYYTAA